MSTNPFDQFDSIEENSVEKNLFDQFDNMPVPDAPDFIPGVQRGLQNLQATSYGAAALAGSGLKKLGAENVGQAIQDFGMEGYRRNIEEAKQYPKKHSFKDIYTGKTDVGGAIDWAQGTLGELVPSMAEAAIGAAVGTAIAPGAGTATGALAGRTILKKGIEKSIQQAMKHGIGDLTESQLRKQITKQALKKLGGKAGIAASVMPMESGGMYADLFEEKGIDAPETALLFGALSTSLEFMGGNSKLVDTFVDALSKGAGKTAKKSAKEILTNIPQEALQEGGQELFSVLNTVANTDEKLLTADHVEQIVESAAAGAVGGAAGSAVHGITNNGPSVEEQLAQETVNINPTEKQKEKGNYKKAPVNIDGFNIMIENPHGTTRKGISADGKEWSTEMSGHYGYFKSSEGKDGDQVDVFIKPGTRTSPEIFVVDQVDPKTKKFDEHKVIFGAKNIQEARDLYLSNYDDDWQGIGNITPMGQNEFKTWLNDEKHTKEPVAKTPQEKQKTYEGLFGQPIINDAEQSAQIFESNAAQQNAILQQILQEKDLQKRQELQNTYNQMFQNFERDAQDSAQTFEEQDLGQFDQLVKDKDQERLDKVLKDIVIESDPQVRQKLYEDLFLQPRIKDAAESAEVFMEQAPELGEADNSSFTNEQQDEDVPQFQAKENEIIPIDISAAINRRNVNEDGTIWYQGDKVDATDEQLIKSIKNISERPYGLNWAKEMLEKAKKLPNNADVNTVRKEVGLNDSRLVTKQDAINQYTKKIADSEQYIEDLKLANKAYNQKNIKSQLERYIKDDSGKELIGFHGTSAEPFDSFDNNKIQTFEHGWSGAGHYFTINKDYATGYAEAAENTTGKPGRIVEARFSFKNPLYKNSPEYKQIIKNALGKTSILNKEDGIKATEAFKAAGYDAVIDGKSLDTAFEINVFDAKNIHTTEGQTQFQATESQEALKQVKLADIEKTFPNQKVVQDTDGTVSVRFKNGKGVNIKSIQDAGQGFIKLAIETGQMSENGKILGITTDNNILLDENFADNRTLWHENKHVLDNLGMITEADNSALNREFNKLRKAGKLEFALSTHEDPKQRMVENRANMFAQIMANREKYRNTSFGKVIQRVMDFFQQMLAMGKQTVSGLAREVESGKIYERKVGNETYQTTVPQAEVITDTWYSALENAVNGFKQKQATPEQWKGMIKNFPGIKPEELEWTGVNEWLDEQKGKVTQKDLADFIRENNVQLEEVHKVEDQDFISHINTKLIPLGYEYTKDMDGSWSLTNRNTGEFTELDEIPENVNAILNDLTNYNVPEKTKYEEYQLPGGKNYQEILLTIPKKTDSRYISGHWDGEPNILAHVRFNERTDADGNKVLFVEEVQSDWHQAGRKRGYNGQKTSYDIKGNTLLDELDQWENIYDDRFVNSEEVNSKHLQMVNAKYLQWVKDNNLDHTDGEFEWIRSIISKDSEQNKNPSREHKYEFTLESVGIPNAPFKKFWPLLAMKRMIKYAAENGFDKVAWTTGEQQAKRYGKENIKSEGMKGFYDKILPAMLNKEFNRGKWGKAKIEITNIPQGEYNSLTNKYYQDGYQTTDSFNVLSIPITNRMRAKAVREGMAMFEIRETPEQKIPQAEYDRVYKQKNNLLKELAQQARIKFSEARLIADKALGSISTRLKKVDPELAQHIRWLDFNTSQKIVDTLKTAKPLLDSTKIMSPEDKSAWNWARLNSDEGKINQLAQKYNLTDHLIVLREKLNKIRKDAIEVGYDVGFIDEYWPRVIKDQEGFLQATQEISQRAEFTEAFREQAKKLGITQEQFEREFPEVKADIISNLILGKSSGIGGPGNIKSRVFKTIDEKYAKFYMDADAALMQYVYSMTKKIEARRFFGKVPQKINSLKSERKTKHADLLKYQQLADMARGENPEKLVDYEDRITNLTDRITLIDEKLNAYKFKNDYTENIGSYIDRMMTDGRIQKKDEKVVRDILTARFNEHGTTGIVNAYKNLSYIDTMGSPLSAITQIGDLAWAMYVGKVWTPKGFSNTVKNLTKAIFSKSNITKEDLGIERIAQEFADGTTLSKGVSKVFKLVGLERIDSIGKEVLINNSLANYKAKAKADPEALAKEIRPTFGRKSTDVVQEILAYNPEDVNSKPSDNVKMLLYSRLLDFQPVALSEMPEYYLNSGNGRVFYMLKTYTLKQFDVFRKEVVHNLKSENPQQKLQGITNMIQLTALLTLANATADEIKDFMLGKETRFSDNVIENFLTMGGASRYLKMQVIKEGFGSALTQQILPPMKFVNAASKDVIEGYKNYVSGDTTNFNHARIIESIPGVGKLYYWHFGRGADVKKTLNEQDFAKVSKDARLFKKQLENSTDKRLFIESNLDRFKQMKLQENFQAALNRNKAVINKLEKIPSTENVQTRLGQLKAQREQILKKYFEVAKTLQ